MGLTINYDFELPNRRITDARQAVKDLRDAALDLPFQEVSEIIELKEGDIESDELIFWTRWWYRRQLSPTTWTSFPIDPTHVIAFIVDPGDGCDSMIVGLCLYPRTVIRDGKRLRTKAPKGWYYKGFCKTQYASNPEYGGTSNFLSCHLSAIHLLDTAKKIGKKSGLTVSVRDEGEYWENRDVQKLAKEVGEWNELVASVARQLQEKFNGCLITQYTTDDVIG